MFPAWAAVVVGALSGPIFLVTQFVLMHFKIDDPLSAIPVHGAGGILGTLAVHVFKAEGGLISASPAYESLTLLGWNVVGLLAIVAWTGLTSLLMFSILAKFNMLRVEHEHEFKGFGVVCQIVGDYSLTFLVSGMDLLKHGESAYPADAWVEQQYMQDFNPEVSDLFGFWKGFVNGFTPQQVGQKDVAIALIVFSCNACLSVASTCVALIVKKMAL